MGMCASVMAQPTLDGPSAGVFNWAATSSVGGCAANIVQDLQNEQYNTWSDGTNTILSQSFTAPTNINVCTFRVFAASDAASSAVCTIQLRTAVNGGGSLLGTSTTNSIAYNGAVPAFYNFTFSSPVAISSGSVVYATLVPADGIRIVTWNRYNTSQIYSGGFCYHNATQGYYDFEFEVWTQ